jgi:hypothetical protein
MIRPVLLVCALAGLLAGLSEFMPGRGTTVEAFQPYYPYPCAFGSGGRDFNGNDYEGATYWDPRTGLWDFLAAKLQEFPVGGIPPGNVTWGQYGDIPVPGDYNNDSYDDVAVWRPSTGTWYVYCSSTTNCAGGYIAFTWGAQGDIPVPADYNLDGFTDYGVWRPSNGTWYVRSGANPSTTLVNAQPWGQYGDCPLPGELVGSGGAALQLNVWRPANGTWYVGRSLTGTGGMAIVYGTYGDIPFALDMDEDGDGDRLLFRPSTGAWYSPEPSITITWGQPGDIPVPRGGVENYGAPAVAVYRPCNRTVYWCFEPSGGACSSSSSTTSVGSPGVVFHQGGVR